MSGEVMALWGIGVLLAAMMLLKVPPGFAMAIVGFGGLVARQLWVGQDTLAMSFSQATTLLTTDLWGSFSNYGLTVIPMFILMGELIFYAGYSDTLYQAAYRWVGHRRGGLAITSILACAGFSSICGSNTATAATMGAVAIPSMRKYKYHPMLMTGAVAAGSTLGVMIPPSIVLVVYALYQYQSIGKLFIGVLIPGLVLTGLLAVTVSVICLRHPEWGPAGERSTWSQRFASLLPVLDVLVLFVAIMIAMFSGIVTATEAAAVGCFLSLVICLFRGKLRVHTLKGRDAPHAANHVHGVHDRGRGGDLRAVHDDQRVAAGGGGLDRIAESAELEHHRDHAVDLHDCGLPDGRAGVPADLAADLLSARGEPGIRPDLAGRAAVPGDDPGGDYAAGGHLLLCHRGHEQGHPHGSGIPGCHVLHAGVHFDGHSHVPVPLLDGADAGEPGAMRFRHGSSQSR